MVGFFIVAWVTLGVMVSFAMMLLQVAKGKSENLKDLGLSEFILVALFLWPIGLVIHAWGWASIRFEKFKTNLIGE